MIDTIDYHAKLAGTDKATGQHGYTRHYEEIVGHLRDEPISILEVGVLRGESARMWLGAFPKARVTAIDIDLSKCSVTDSRLTLCQADIFDSARMREIVAEHGPFDFAVEDSLHTGAGTKAVVESLWPHGIKPGGWLFIEDIHSKWAYKKKRIGANVSDCQFNYARSMVDAVCRHRHMGHGDDVWDTVSDFDREIRRVIYYPGLCCLQKA